jgi:hypothetical protein
MTARWGVWPSLKRACQDPQRTRWQVADGCTAKLGIWGTQATGTSGCRNGDSLSGNPAPKTIVSRRAYDTHLGTCHGACHASRHPTTSQATLNPRLAGVSCHLTCPDTSTTTGPHDPRPTGSQEVRGFKSHRLHYLVVRRSKPWPTRSRRVSVCAALAASAPRSHLASVVWAR